MHTWLRFWLGESCRLCKVDLLPKESGICVGCSGLLPFAWLDEGLLLASEDQAESQNVRVRSWLVFSEKNAVRHLIHRIKYKSDRPLAVDLGRAMGRDLGSLSGISIPEIWIPVPLHPKRLRQRGYNQSEALAQGLQSELGGRVESRILKRDKHSESQTKNSRNARSNNVAHAFSCKPGILLDPNIRIAVVDDVITTGSTLKACCSALQAAGFTNVQAWTLGCSGWL